MDPELRKLDRTMSSLDVTSNESVLNFQKMANAYTNESSGIGMYPDRDLLKEDGLYGKNTRTRIGKLREFINERIQDSVFDSQESKRTDFFRDYMWTRPEDTLGVQGAKHYKSTEMLKAKVKDYNKGGN